MQKDSLQVPINVLKAALHTLACFERYLDDKVPLPAKVNDVALADSVSWLVSGINCALLDNGIDPDS